MGHDRIAPTSLGALPCSAFVRGAAMGAIGTFARAVYLGAVGRARPDRWRKARSSVPWTAVGRLDIGGVEVEEEMGDGGRRGETKMSRGPRLELVILTLVLTGVVAGTRMVTAALSTTDDPPLVETLVSSFVTALVLSFVFTRRRRR